MAKARRGSNSGAGRQAARPAAAPAAAEREIELAPLTFLSGEIAFRAADGTELDEADDETREIDVTFTTGAGVERYDWRSGERYIETLSLDPAHVRLGRLNSGASLLDSHSSYALADIVGAVVPGTAALTKKEGRARVRFSKRDEVAGIWRDVKDKIIRFLSFGYIVHRYEETPAGKGSGNKLPIRKAIDWEPYELSLVPIPADAGAQTRGQRPAVANRCTIVPAPVEAHSEETVMKVRTPAPAAVAAAALAATASAEVIVEDDPLGRALDPEADDDPEPAQAAEPTDIERAVARERTRSQGILKGCRAARLPQAFADTLIGDPKCDLERAQTLILEELAKRGGDDRGPSRTPSGRPEIIVGDDPLVHQRAMIVEALCHRAAPEQKTAEKTPAFPLSEGARRYRGLSLLDLGAAMLRARGFRTTGLSKVQLAGEILGLRGGGMHSTSDFANILADVQGKMLRSAYEEARQTWRVLARLVPLPDFKAAKHLQFGEAPDLEEVLEHGEFTRGTIVEGKEQFALATYGKIFAITRQALINDDLEAFARVPLEFGRAARRKESDLAWAQITSNPTMGDGTTLFHADHSNVSGSPSAISVDSIGAGRAAMRKQTGVDGTSLIDVSPSWLIVPVALETKADTFVSNNLMASEPGNINPFAGKLAVVAEPRLDVASASAWYLGASPSAVDVLLYAVLDGQEGPTIETRVGFDVDGVETKCRLDVGFKVADHRGLYKNS
jgi:hypothetical protein